MNGLLLPLNRAFSTQKYRLQAFFLLALFCLAGCSPIIVPAQASNLQYFPLQAGETVGQTFVSRHAGLNGIEIYFRQDFSQTGNLVLHLRHSPQEETDLASAAIPLTQVIGDNYHRFVFPALHGSTNKTYYLELELQGTGKTWVSYGYGDRYLDGSMYHQRQPIDPQMTFRLLYDPLSAALGLAKEGFSWLVFLLLCIFLFILPGWATLLWLYPKFPHLDWVEKSAYAAAVSLALYPLLILWSSLIGLKLGMLTAWLPPIVGLLALGIKYLRQYPTLPKIPLLRTPIVSCENIGRVFTHPSFLALLVLSVILFTRLWVIRSLGVPLWMDSYHHTIITQLLLDQGSLPTSWHPYAELDSFSYHFGFHAAATAYAWLSHASAPQAVLWVGQWINLLAVLSIYPLARRIYPNPWSGFSALLIAGLFFSLPMYYVNWGRYTQLSSMALLPIAICLVWDIFEPQTVSYTAQPLTRYAIGWIILSGLALIHYRIFLFAALFLPIIWIFKLGRNRLEYPRQGFIIRLRTLFIRSCWLLLGAGLLYVPWLLNILSSKLNPMLVYAMTTPPTEMNGLTQRLETLSPLSSYLPVWAWVLLPIVLGWGLWKRLRPVLILGAWCFLILLAANTAWLNLPGMGILSNGAVFLAAYLPASALLGAGLGWLCEQRIPHLPAYSLDILLIPALLLVGFCSIPQRLDDLHIVKHIFVTRPDLQAADWIRQNIPTDARFLVNSFFGYDADWDLGNDAGWWLPILAQRKTTLPPMIYPMERSQPGYTRQVMALTQAVTTNGAADPTTLSLLCQSGATHVYIGQLRGMQAVGPPLIQPSQLLQSPHFRLLYHQDRTWVFEIRYQTDSSYVTCNPEP